MWEMYSRVFLNRAGDLLQQGLTILACLHARPPAIICNPQVSLVPNREKLPQDTTSHPPTNTALARESQRSGAEYETTPTSPTSHEKLESSPESAASLILLVI